LNVASREFVHLSDQYYQIFGFDPDEGIPSLQTIRQRLDPEDRATNNASLEKAILEGNDFELNYRITFPDGTVKFIHSVAHPVFNASFKTPVEFVGTAMDVTERKRAEENLRESERRYRQAQAELAHVARVTALGEMSASIAHEVNQPLAAIVNNAEATVRWLGHDVPNLEEARAAIGRVAKAAHRAGEVIRRVRDFSKKADPQMTQLEINEVVEEALSLVQHEALRHEVAIRFEPASGLPPVRGDRIQLQQVIVNLAVNGMEAMSTIRERERMLIVHTQADESDRVLVAVKDAGVGNEPENLNRVFSAFHTTKQSGLGMGLSICRSIVEAHGGRLWACSNSGPGMTFQFVIPASAQQGAQPHP
jgi:PAS domain S-box-containing protein